MEQNALLSNILKQFVFPYKPINSLSKGDCRARYIERLTEEMDQDFIIGKKGKMKFNYSP